MDLDIPLIETGLFSSRDSFYHVVMQRNIKTVRDLLNSEEEILRRKFKTKKNFQGFFGSYFFVADNIAIVDAYYHENRRSPTVSRRCEPDTQRNLCLCL